MTAGCYTIAGETYLSLEVVAECYECDAVWIREVYELGLLGSGQLIEGETLVPARALDRVAQIVRLSVHHSLSLEIVAGMLEIAD